MCAHANLLMKSSSMPLLSYGFGNFDWTVAEISQMDAIVHNVMVSANSLHPRSTVECLYLPHHIGGRGLLGVENLYRHHAYVVQSFANIW